MDGKWNSRRSPVYARNGMVATSQPLATEVGLSILKAGGNAADAAVGVAAALNVVQPMSTGIGGDAFVLFYDAQQKQVKGLNASGRCPASLSLEVLADLGYNEQNRPPTVSPYWVTVPGAAAGRIDTLELFGHKKLTLGEILASSIALAEEGFPVHPACAHTWAEFYDDLASGSPYSGELLLNGRPPVAGEIFRNPGLAQTYRDMVNFGKAGFYEGRVAEAIVEVMQEVGGYFSASDLTEHFNTQQDTPIHVNYRGVDVYEMPPNGQGITALLALNILKGFNLSQYEHNSAEHLHRVIESLRLAFADTRYFVADPTFPGVEVPVAGLLSEAYATQRRNLIKPDAALINIEHGSPPSYSNTVYFSVVDGEGNACSFINSLYRSFGSCVVPRGCGFALQNRGDSFSLDPNSVNCLAPKKRPYHTIIPGMALKDGELFCPFGVMGGFMQPQGHVQVISNMVDFNMNPQEALDAPRMQILDGTPIGDTELEDGIDESVGLRLAIMGHKNPTLVHGWGRKRFGVGQIITRDPTTGVLCAGSDPRNDGMAIGW